MPEETTLEQTQTDDEHAEESAPAADGARADALDDLAAAPLVASEPPPTEYDATARQRVSATVQTEAGPLPVTLIYEPYAGGRNFDTRLQEYARRVNAAPATDSPEDETEARAEAKLDASAYLFGEVITDVEGIGEEGEDKPANWRDYFTRQEKFRVVEEAILAGSFLDGPTVKGRVSWAGLAASTLRLRVLFDGHSIDTRHTLKKADTPVLRETAAVLTKMAEGANIYVELAAVYRKLKVSARGYKDGIVPLHHQAFAAFGHLSTQLRVTRKN